MNRILRRAQFPWMRRLGMIGKYVAIIAIVLFITCNNDILTYGESKFTSEFYSYTTEGRPNVVWYCFPIEDIAKAPKTIETLFEVTYIPEGYELVEHQVSIYKYKNNTYRYENADGDYILFQQNALSRGVGFQLPHWTLEEVQYQDIMILFCGRYDDRDEHPIEHQRQRRCHRCRHDISSRRAEQRTGAPAQKRR